MSLELENIELRIKLAECEREILFMKSHDRFMQCLRGEMVVRKLTGGELTGYTDSYDVLVGDEIKIEVKFSHLNTPVASSPTRRWNWSAPMGWQDGGKEYDFLLLVGDKDRRFDEYVVDDSPFVYFLLPKKEVPFAMSKGVTIGGMINLSSNLATIRSDKGKAVRSRMISANNITRLFSEAA